MSQQTSFCGKIVVKFYVPMKNMIVKLYCVNSTMAIEKGTSILYSVKCKPRHYRNEVP